MKYTTEILVDVPISDFIKKLNNAENLKHWQRGLVSYDYISGTPGHIGAKIKLVYKLGKRTMELIETITDKKLPNEFHLMYETKDMQNIQENYFEEVAENTTKWISKNEFIPLNFSLRMMIILMPRVFKKQSKQYLQDFKNFAENGTSVRHAKA